MKLLWRLWRLINTIKDHADCQWWPARSSKCWTTKCHSAVKQWRLMPSLVVHFLTSHAMSEVSRRAMQRHPFLCHRHWFHAFNMTYAFNVRGTSRLWGLWCHDCSILQSPSVTSTFTEALDGCEPSEVVTNSCEGQGLWTWWEGPMGRDGTPEAKCLKYRWTPSGSEEQGSFNSQFGSNCLEVSVSCGQGARSWDTARGDSRDSRPAQWAHSWKNQHGSTWINND